MKKGLTGLEWHESYRVINNRIKFWGELSFKISKYNTQECVCVDMLFYILG